jgi:endo-1,4-beta-xylanase
VGGSREATSDPKAPSGGAFGKTGIPAGGTGSKSDPLGTGGSKPTGGSSSSGTGTTTPNTAPPKPLQKFVGNITTGNGSVDYGEKTYSKYWDQITPENAGKWGSVQSTPTSDFNWKTLDAIYDYTQKNNIVFKQHAFIWGVQQPSGTPTADQVKTWMKEFCNRYPATRVIDVVNEPPPHTTPNYVNNMGGGTNGDWKWIANAFTWAREACPNAVLVLNDFNDIEWSADNQRMIDIVKKLKAQNAPIDAIGAQSHDLDHASVSSNTVMSLIKKLHEDTGLPIYITEMDIDTSDDAKQLSLYKTYMPFFLETEWVHGVTIWGWHYGRTWNQAPNSGLIRDGKFRSAMTWLMETLGRSSS